MVSLYDVPADALIEEAADRLADRIDEPEWVQFTKSGANRELPPEQEDFWFVRSASLLRKVATNEPIGIERLATEYGGKKRGSNRYVVAPGTHAGGSRKIIRASLQALEEEGLVETAQGEGRRVTDEGHTFLNEVADSVLEDLDRPELERYA
ncbi:30S ribosomal protein S19e [Halopenitus persicus]|uniref:Small ribosomal subunit protein eS19 n=1 Tax=Halopenitus persicus TaxID=1048396 RepID=A0A1H3DWX4_9EURY|nr:30S ribosomal protein S19e [Halopenitus persicus]QHS16398.1 30S ribosomal protein S19e [haloarchaeon 3A1-DGR]SDX70628.1 SSU ribosomal protein S19E [Halopenitus persicus]